MLKLISFKKPYLYLIISAVLFVLWFIFYSLPSLSAPFCALGVDPDRCNSKVPNWVQSCRNCDADPDNEWCNTTDCAATGQVCVNGTCQTASICTDNDSDGYGVCPNCGLANGCASDGDDCDDAKNFKNPGAAETCDNYDNNCNGIIDEGCDDDGDDYCDKAMYFYNYPVTTCPNSNLINGLLGDDCNDANGSIKPGVSDICGNGIDEDCSGLDTLCPSALTAFINYPADGDNYVQGSSVLTVIASAVGGAPPYNFLWNSDLAGDFSYEQSAQVSIAGWTVGIHTITATVTDSTNQTNSKSIKINIAPANSLVANITITQTEWARDPNYKFFYGSSVQGGVGPYTYIWNSDQQGNFSTTQMGSIDISSWALGNHLIKVTIADANGQTAVDSMTIKIADMTFNLYPKDGASYEQMQDVYFSAVVYGGNSPFTYNWQSNLDGSLRTTGPTTSKQDSFLIDSLSVGAHIITSTVTDSSGLSLSKTAQIQINPLTPITVNITSPANNSAYQQGTAISFDANPTGGVMPYTYVWSSSKDGNIFSGGVNGVIPGFTKNNLSVGTHIITLTVTDFKGNIKSGSININITIPSPLTPSIISPVNGSIFKAIDNFVIFEGTALGGATPYTFSWSSNRDGNIGTGAKAAKNNLSIGNHIITLTITDSAANSVSKTVNITVNAGCANNNTKNNTKYSAQELFLISSDDWRDVLSLVPLTTWKSGVTLKNYPALIFHNEASSSPVFDADSIIHFMQLYSPDHLTTIKNIPSAFNNLLVAAPPTGAGLNSANIYNINSSDYFSYWSSFGSLVVVDYDNYKAGLMASVFASYKNSPIIFVNSANLSAYQTMMNGKTIYTVGSLDAATQNYINSNVSCQVNYTLDEAQKWYANVTGSDKLIFVNPNDLSIKYDGINNPYPTEKSGLIFYPYAKMSLAAPFLAAAKEEVIGYSELPATQSSGLCNNSISLTNNVSQANADSANAIQGLFLTKPKFLTVIAAPRALPDSKWEKCESGGYLRNPRDWIYGSIGDADIELLPGRIHGLTVSDTSSYIARAINFDYLYNKIYSGNYNSFSLGRAFAEARNDALIVKNKTANSGYNAICYVDSSLAGCTTAQNPPFSSYQMRNYIAYLGHGQPTMWMNTPKYNQIPWLDIPVGVAASCRTNDTWESYSRNFGVHMIRRGAIAYIGAVGTSWTTSFPIPQSLIKSLGGNYSITLGEAYKMSLSYSVVGSDTYWKIHYSLLGDPTLQPKFKAIAW